MLDFAGMDGSKTVLDAGCGSGGFIPLLLARGVTTVFAFDVALEHLASLGRGSSADLVACQSAAEAVPLADSSIDGVWCANTLQYLDDEQARTALSEFRRVVRPGGVVAIKDVDMTAFKISPAPPFLGAHLAEACLTGEEVTKQSRGSLRGRDLRLFLQDAGFDEVGQRTFAIERWGPLGGPDAAFWRAWLPYLAALAEANGVPELDLQTWRAVATPELAQAFVASPSFYGCELQVVATGRRPGR